MNTLWLSILLAVCFFGGAFAFAALTVDPFIAWTLRMHSRGVDNSEKGRKRK